MTGADPGRQPAEGAGLDVLIVEDDADTRSNLRDILELDCHRVDAASSIAEALARARWRKYSAILLDRRLPDGTAEELLPRLRELAPQASVLIVTGFADLQGVIAALRAGASDYILKPIHAEALRLSLERIAERQRLALDKERSEIAFRSLVEAAPCLVVILRPDQRAAYFSHYAEELTGFQRREVLERESFLEFVPEECRSKMADSIRRSLSGEPCRGLEIPIVCKDRSRRWILWNAQRLPDYEGGPAVLAVGQDFTGLKEAQDQALQAERLAAIGQMVAFLAHESGNALARSKACLEMLSWDLDGQPEAQQLVAQIQNAQDHLQQLYEDVRSYAAPLKLQREPWDVSSVWRLAWDNVSVLRQGKQVELHEHTGGLDLECWIDQFRLGQVFRNIFENSLAACAEPVHIDITCTESQTAGRPMLCVAVRDNGPGLTPEQRAKIFEPFFTTKTKGTGLGMAIAKRVIDAHQGQMSVGSSDRGAEILFTLPREPA